MEINNNNTNQISEDIINNQVSYGSFGYLNAFSNSYNFQYKWNLFPINMLTLCRNIMSFIKNDNLNINTIPLNTIQDYLAKDINMITTYIKRYIDITANMSGTLNTSYKVIFYFPKYDEIINLNQETYKQPIKVFKENLIIYNKIYNLAIRNNRKYDTLIKKDNLVSYVFFKPEMYSSISLFRLLNNKFRFKKQIVLITHMPLDYFLIKFIPEITFMDSFTGKILTTKEEISKKIFKSTTVPFNKYMLFLYGDKYLLKSHLPHGMKTKLTLIANTEKWNLLSEDQIKSKLISMNLIENNKYNFYPY